MTTSDQNHRDNDVVIITELRALKDLLSLEIEYLKKSISELETRTEDNVRSAKESIAAYNKSLNERVTILELWQSNAMGKVAVIFTIIGITATAFVSWVFKHF